MQIIFFNLAIVIDNLELGDFLLGMLVGQGPPSQMQWIYSHADWGMYSCTTIWVKDPVEILGSAAWEKRSAA